MTGDTDYIIQSMFDRESLEEMTIDEMQAKVEQYPYSSIIHYLYSFKLKTTYDNRFPDSVAKTSLYFSNSQWLYYQLSDALERGMLNGILESDFQDLNENALNEIQNSTTEINLHDTETSENQTFEDINDDFLETQQQEINLPGLKEVSEPIVQDGDTESRITFEPYHTIDYFASQGIKLGKIDDKDVLGQKVKSFTAWLKTMKKLDQPSIENIQPLTNESDKITSPNEIVVTETMAEVYVKQGAYSKAIAVLEKLSLQNPDNSHIFASRIEALKEKIS